MGIFKFKFDKDALPMRLEFNYDTNQFVYYYGDTEIPFDRLSLKTKKALKKENERLINEPGLLDSYLKNKRMRDYRDYLREIGIKADDFQTFGTGGQINEDIEYYLDNLINEENVLLGVHRIKPTMSEEQIRDVLLNGLKLTGHLDGAIRGTDEISNNVSFYTDNNVIKNQLMYANGYKDSKGSFLIRLPLYDIEEGMIYKVDEEGNLRVNPFYIVGYFPVNDKCVETIITKEDLEQNKNNIL